MSALLPKRVVVHPGTVFCENCGGVMYIGRYRQTQNYLTAECLSQHCVDRGSVFKLPLDVRELEREKALVEIGFDPMTAMRAATGGTSEGKT